MTTELTPTADGISTPSTAVTVEFDYTERGIEVLCLDGVRRHPRLFPTRREASDWAWWGHCCAATHSMHEVTR